MPIWGGGGGAAAGAIGSTLAERIAQFAPHIFYTLDETSGTTATDDRAEQDATYIGTPSLNQTGIVDSVGCPDFDGTDDGIRLPVAFEAGGHAVAVYAVIEPDALSGKQVIWKAGGTANGWVFYLDGANLAISNTDSSGVDANVVGGTTLSVDTVYHVVGVLTMRGTAAVYVNGVVDGVSVQPAEIDGLLATGTDDSTIGTANDASAAGTRFGDNTTSSTAWYNGKISHVALFPHVLKDWEIKALYDGTIL